MQFAKNAVYIFPIWMMRPEGGIVIAIRGLNLLNSAAEIQYRPGLLAELIIAVELSCCHFLQGTNDASG